MKNLIKITENDKHEPSSNNKRTNFQASTIVCASKSDIWLFRCFLLPGLLWRWCHCPSVQRSRTDHVQQPWKKTPQWVFKVFIDWHFHWGAAVSIWPDTTAIRFKISQKIQNPKIYLCWFETWPKCTCVVKTCSSMYIPYMSQLQNNALKLFTWDSFQRINSQKDW